MAEEVKNKVLLCGIGKLENNYIREWVEYHQKLGFTNIVLYDNNDVDGEHFEDVIGDYIDSGYVILKDWRGRALAQIPSYNECYYEYKDNYDWIGFWDIDEFIEFDKCKTIQEFVNNPIFNRAKCIRICWKQYTDNNLLSVKDNNFSVTRFKEVFDKGFCVKNKIPTQHAITSNTQAKSLLRTNIEDFQVTSPHCFLNVPTVDAVGRKCEIGIRIGNMPVWKGAWLNHYRFKTIEEYVTKKMVRLWPTAYKNGGKDRLDLDYFFMFNKKTHDKLKYAKELTGSVSKKKFRLNTWTERDKQGKLKNKNWGDELNFYFLQKLFGNCLVDYKRNDVENYTMIGSILNDTYVDNNSIVWGSGIQVTDKQITHKPKKVCAVRGPLTRKYLLENGIDCPEVYGDPSLLLPYYYYPNVEKKYEIGFIPHWSSINSAEVRKFCKDKRVHLIKLSGYTNWLTIIDEILSCKYIVSESLHGIIMAEAYGVPNLWADVTLKNVFDIKFHDFFQSIGLDRKKPVKINGSFTVEKALEELKKYKRGTMVDLNALVDACPIEITNKEFLNRVRNNIIVKKNKINMNGNYEEGVSICITAYKAKEFLKETLDSIYLQTWFLKHNNWEVILGIDCCPETCEYVKTIMDNYKNLKVYMMTSNMGTYVTSNTIMSLAKYDGLIRFDSDDIMLPNMVETIMTNKGKADFINFKMENFGRRGGIQWAGGQMWVKHSVFDKLGGYMPWSCSADTEFEIRCKKFFNCKKIDKVLMKRRIHKTNLTVAKETNFSSPVRKANLNYVFKVTQKFKNLEDAIIKKKTNTYQEITSSGDNAFINEVSDYVVEVSDVLESGTSVEENIVFDIELMKERKDAIKAKTLEYLGNNKKKIEESAPSPKPIVEKKPKDKTAEEIIKKKETNKVVVKKANIIKTDPRFDTNW